MTLKGPLIAVSADARSQGLGARLLAALECEAAKSGIEVLYLITIDADGFFLKFGYTAVERAATPPKIRATREYSELCPGDAIVMCKDLQAVHDT